MTFKIHSVYKQMTKPVTVNVEEKKESETNNVNELSLSSSSVSSQSKTLQQQRAEVLNSRSSIKPGTKNGIRASTFEGGLEADML
jgi:hypothetical protein